MTRPKLTSFAPRMSLPLTENSPFESIAGRNRWVSKPLPLAEGMTFGVDCARACRTTPERPRTTPSAKARRSIRRVILRLRSRTSASVLRT